MVIVVNGNDYYSSGAFAGFGQSDQASGDLFLTPAERDRAVNFLKMAYEQGLFSEAELDHRLGIVLSAKVRSDLAPAFANISSANLAMDHPNMPMAAGHVGVPVTKSDLEKSSLAYFLGIFAPLVAPLAVYFTSGNGSRAKRNAARAFDMQLKLLIPMFFFSFPITVLGAGSVFGALSFIGGLFGLAYVVLNVLGGMKTLKGEIYQDPLRQIGPNVLDNDQ